VWVCGCVGVWVCGCVGVWVCGCVGVWVCGCVGVRVLGYTVVGWSVVPVNISSYTWSLLPIVRLVGVK